MTAIAESALPITLADVADAMRQLAGMAIRTPLLESEALNRLVKGRLLVKAEMLQRTGSFKFRGAYNRISRLTAEERTRGVIAFSSGNHAQGVAAAAALCGTPAVIIMPDDAPAVKRTGTESWGAEVVAYRRSAGESREATVADILKTRDLVLVKPFDEPLVMAGQGTAGLEIVEQAEAMNAAIDQVLVPCSGGGLLAGIATAVCGNQPEASVYSVEPAGFDDMARSLTSGRSESNAPGVTSFCDALMAPEPGILTLAVAGARCAGGLSVSDAEVAEAMRMAFLHLKVVIEPGGAVTLAAALKGKIETAGKTTVVLASGGNVDPKLFAEVLQGR